MKNTTLKQTHRLPIGKSCTGNYIWNANQHWNAKYNQGDKQCERCIENDKNNSTPKWQTMSRLLESLKFWTQQEVVHLASNIAAQTRHPEPHEQNITLGVPKPTPHSNAHSSSHTQKLRSGNTDNGTRAQIDNNQTLRHDTPQNTVNANATTIVTPRQLEI